MSAPPQKIEETANVNAKNIIANFEKGSTTQNGNSAEGSKNVEKPVARPGAAKKLLKEYEEKNKPEPTPEIARTGKRPVFGGTAMNGDATPAAADEVPKVKRKVLLIFGHIERKSFNGQLCDQTVKFLEGQGHEVTVRDLHQMDWKLPSRADAGVLITLHPSPTASANTQEVFNYEEAMHHAYEHGNVSPDIREEQTKVQEADLIILQFPIHNSCFPAILKSWIERVMCSGFAFDPRKGALFEDGHMKGKRLVLSTTTASPIGAYTSSGVMGDMDVPLWVMEYGSFRFFGFDILPATIYHGINGGLSEELRQQYTSDWLKRLDGIFTEEPKKFIDMKRFDLKDTWQMKPDDPIVKDDQPPNVAQRFS